MHRGHTVSVVVPCYNEEEGIRQVIEKMPEVVDEIVVADNNSTDRTAEVAESLGAKVVFQPKKGYGYAYQAGIPAATKDLVVTLDGDGSYPVSEIPPVLEYLLDHDLDFVSASRFPLKSEGSMSFMNRVGNKILTLGMQVLFFHPIVDSQSGMWAFKRSVYPKLNVTSGGMPFSQEIKIEAIKRRGVRFGECHIDYHPRIGEVKLRMWQDGFLNLLFLVKKRFSR